MCALALVAAESGQLRRCLRDLLALNALPALWQHQHEQRIAESTADALIGVLGLDFVYVSLEAGGPDAPQEVLRLARTPRVPEAGDIRSSLIRELRRPLPQEPLRTLNLIGAGPVQVTFVRIGLSSDEILVAAARRPSFPDEMESLLLGVAANQMALAFQSRRAERALVASEARYRELSENLEQRVVERTRALEAEKAERERAEAAFRQAQRMEAMGHLTGGVAHDFNNLLLVISGNLELLRTRVNPNWADRQLDAIERATRRGESLTRHLLSFSRRQTLQPSILDLAERLPELMELIRPSLRGDIEIRLESEPGIWPVRADPGELELALLNMAVNARDAMPGGGLLLVSARNHPVRSPEISADVDPGEYVAISLRDTGEGIPADILPLVFEPFYTTKDAGHGSGLGLSQVYGFARQSGGTVLISSQLGQGTTVTILLPKATGVTASRFEAVRNRIDERIIGTVLLVEDNEEVADVTASLLEALGCRIRHARNATEALDVFMSGGIDLVLSDIVMPGDMNGLDLARSLRDRFPGLPILLTTGYSTAAQDAAREQFAILPKPYRRNQLAQAISHILAARPQVP